MDEQNQIILELESIVYGLKDKLDASPDGNRLSVFSKLSKESRKNCLGCKEAQDLEESREKFIEYLQTKLNRLECMTEEHERELQIQKAEIVKKKRTKQKFTKRNFKIEGPSFSNKKIREI